MPSGGTWVKMLTIGTSICIGGPALVYWVSPTEEELFKKYNPDLQKRSLETRDVRQQEFDTFVSKLKEYSKSDRPIWVVAAEDERRTKRETAEKKEAERLRLADEKEKLRNEIRRHSSGREA